MEITIIKKKTKTKLEEKKTINFEDIFKEHIPSHYSIVYNCEICGTEIKIKNFGSFKKKKRKGLCQSCSIKEEWKDNNYKIKHSETIREAFKDENKRKKRSKISRNNWKNKDYRKKTLLSLKKVQATLEYRNKLSVKQKERWKNEEYRKKMFSIFRNCITGLKVKNVTCRSFAEYTFLKLIEHKVRSFELCNFYIPYTNKNGELKNYIPDFKIINQDDSITIIEVKGSFVKDFRDSNINTKPYSLNRKTNKLKEDALIEFCKEKNWKYELITFDNREFYNLYKQERKKLKYENSKN